MQEKKSCNNKEGPQNGKHDFLRRATEKTGKNDKQISPGYGQRMKAKDPR